MLRKRVITALPLLVFTLAVVLLLETHWFAVFTAVFVLLGAWEWLAMAAPPGNGRRLAGMVMLAVLGVGGYLSRGLVGLPIVHAGTAWWLLATIMVLAVACGRLAAGWRPGLRLAMVLPVLFPAWLALVIMHERPGNGPWLVTYLLALVWVADTAAYLAGQRWGRHKLCPRVSPGKTWEGLAAALCGGLLLGLGFGLWNGLATGAMVPFVLLTLMTVLASVMGDLLESLLKRGALVKDSGTLLPGHGGVLDRVDSVTAAAPVFLTGLTLLGTS